MTQVATRKQTEITAAAINRVNSKNGKFLGYLIKSDSSEDYYEVTWNEKRHMWQCKCPASVAECKHCRAASQVCQAKAESQQQVEKPAVASEDETVEVMVGNTKIVASRKNIDNAVAHHQWGIDVVAAVEGGKSEARYFEQKRALDEQYSKAPSAWELSETQASEMRHFYDAY